MTLAPDAWRNRSVFVTGHTGFKGGWLSLLLDRLGARVHGYALDPDPSPSMFDVANVARSLVSDIRADLADLASLRNAVSDARPEVLIHLAAQPLVRQSYLAPLETFATNVMGTAHVLEVARDVPSVRAVVIVTTDKVYANNGMGARFIETDALGGDDPYSASKAAAELVSASYRRSFFSGAESARVASARAGNVIGGGDWATDRLVPDCMRAFAHGLPVHLRYPSASRPWQHVLEPLSGYLQLAGHLLGNDGKAFAHGWNFGPGVTDQATVGDVAQRMARLWSGDARVVLDTQMHPHEAGSLALDSSAAAADLGWHPRWSLDEALGATVAWQRQWLAGADMHAFTQRQIADYLEGSPA
ncbi:CDP-glucose 4,6-dehydratase [Luteibacter sp. 9133]|uniref:CDP-glucose 4,6-dehydratase n=1 Tax=Luteibacter sp. 9133 TaxID=1500891 RepID=UPI0005BDB376|nr:CDP-glucose 4,6-dehydratase [Luteibacter sp. 9133]